MSISCTTREILGKMARARDSSELTSNSPKAAAGL